jgi:ABC-type branched-subunit amino acid transport system ATPase component
VISIRNLRKSYGGVRALAGCDLEIARPGIYGLIGPNGAGKTTLFDVMTGVTEPDGGEVFIDGRDVTGWPAHRLAQAGVARTFQECRVFPEFSCRENLLFRNSDEDEARRLLSLVNLERYADEPASSLSFGQRRLLEIVGTFMGKPRVLLLDEPASGVNPALLELLLEFIRRMYEERPLFFLVVEHNMEFVMALASEVIVMHQGAVLERGTPQAIQASERVMDAYLG